MKGGLLRAGFAAPAIGLAGLSLPLLTYLPSFYAGLGVPLASIGAVFLLVRILDMAVDPLIGVAVDRTGALQRHRTWLLLATPALMAGTAMLFFPPANVGASWLLAALLLTYIGYSAYGIAHLGWGCALAEDRDGRNWLFGWAQAAHVAGVLIPAIIPLFVATDPARAATPTALFILIALLAGVVVACLILPLPTKQGSGQRARLRDVMALVAQPSMLRLLAVDMLTGMAVFTCGTLFFLYFGARALEGKTAAMLFLLTNLGSLPGALLWAWLGGRIGKAPAAGVAFVAFALLLALIALLPAAPGVRTATLLLLFGATLCAGPVLIRSMLADVAEVERQAHGVDQSGLIAALFLSSNKLGMAIGPGIAFMLLDRAGFVPGAPTQAPAALAMLDMLAIWAPASIALLSTALILPLRRPLS